MCTMLHWFILCPSSLTSFSLARLSSSSSPHSHILVILLFLVCEQVASCAFIVFAVAGTVYRPAAAQMQFAVVHPALQLQQTMSTRAAGAMELHQGQAWRSVLLPSFLFPPNLVPMGWFRVVYCFPKPQVFDGDADCMLWEAVTIECDIWQFWYTETTGIPSPMECSRSPITTLKASQHPHLSIQHFVNGQEVILFDAFLT